MRPWWWIDEAERARLGIGSAVRRTERGVLFGDVLEILPRCEDAPVRLGPIALRLWGSTTDRRGRMLLRAVVDLLGPRLADEFDPAAVAIDETSAPATIIDVPSVCDRACVFCHLSQRPIAERTPRGADVDVERAIAGTTGAILFTGDDALSHPRIVEWIERASRGGRSVSVIGPPRRGVTAVRATELARAGLRKWITALLGASPPMHDRIAGREGAHEALVEAVAAMRGAGVVVELVTPLIAPLLSELPAIVARAEELASGRHTLLAYAPDSMVGHDFDALVPCWDALREALASVAGASVDALPLCVLPESMRSSASFERTDARLQVLHPQSTCSGCELRPRCPGVPSTVERAVGTAGLRRQTSSCGGGAGPS